MPGCTPSHGERLRLRRQVWGKRRRVQCKNQVRGALPNTVPGCAPSCNLVFHSRLANPVTRILCEEAHALPLQTYHGPACEGGHGQAPETDATPARLQLAFGPEVARKVHEEAVLRDVLPTNPSGPAGGLKFRAWTIDDVLHDEVPTGCI